MENIGSFSLPSSPDIESIVEIEQSLQAIRAEIADRIREVEVQRDSLEEDFSAGLLSDEDYRFFVDDIKYLLDEQFKLLLLLEDLT